MNTQSVASKSSNKKIILIAGGSLIGLCVLCLIFGAISNAINPAATKPSADVNAIYTSAVLTVVAPMTQTAQARPNATSTPVAANVPSSTATALDPKVTLRQNIEKVLGSSNRKVQRITALNFDDPEQGTIFVNWTIDDNLTNDMIIFGAKKDATDILKTVSESGIDYTYVLLSGSFPLTDNFGNTKETSVVNLTFYKATVAKINWKNFISDDIYKIADTAAVWKVFQTP